MRQTPFKRSGRRRREDVRQELHVLGAHRELEADGEVVRPVVEGSLATFPVGPSPRISVVVLQLMDAVAKPLVAERGFPVAERNFISPREKTLANKVEDRAFSHRRAAEIGTRSVATLHDGGQQTAQLLAHYRSSTRVDNREEF